MHSRNFYFQSVQHPQLSEGVRGGKELQQVLSRVFQKNTFFKKIKSGTHQTAQTFTFFFMFEISILWRESITDPKVFTFIFSGKVCLYLVENRTTRMIQQPQTWFRFWFVVVHQLCSLVNDIYFWSIWCNHFQILSITTFREELFQFWDPEQCKARQYEGMEGVQDWMDYDDDEDEDDDDYNLGLYWDIWFALWSSLWWQS